jgi:hypothetical protein
MSPLANPFVARLAVLELEQQGSTILRLDEQIANIRDDLHPGQLEFVDDNQTQILGISAGYGAGKTRALCAKAVMLAVANQGFIGAVMEPTGPLVRDIWMSDFDDFLDAYGIPYTFRARRCRSTCCTYQAVIPRSCVAASRTGHASSA